MPSETIQKLRQQLRDQFPAAHREVGGGGGSAQAAEAAAHRFWNFQAGISSFPPGAITEISPAHPACGLTLLFAALLSSNETNSPDPPSEIPNPQFPLVLIDARDRFDPASFSTEACQRLLWLRCRETHQALQSADLLLRDGNLPFILLDLSSLPARELRRIPTSAWHRLRQLAETSQCTLLALTPSPLIPRAALRLTLTRDFDLQHLDLSRRELVQNLQAEAQHRRLHTA